MHIPPTRVLSVRLPALLVDVVQQTADQQGIAVSEVVRAALLTHMARDPATQWHLTVLYEVAKTRALLLRLLDTQLGKEETDKLLALAEQDAQLYVQETQGAGR